MNPEHQHDGGWLREAQSNFITSTNEQRSFSMIATGSGARGRRPRGHATDRLAGRFLHRIRLRTGGVIGLVLCRFLVGIGT